MSILLPGKKSQKVRTDSGLMILDRVALALLFAFLSTEILGGAVAYYAARSGFPWLPYLPYLLVTIAIVPMFVGYVLTEGVTETYLTIFVLLGVAGAYGLLNLNSTRQVEFGFWVLVPFLFGIVVLPSFLRGWRRFTPYAVVLWALAVVGVLINVFYQWPWIGFEYQVAGFSVEAGRLWHTSGLDFNRIAGFSRFSFEVSVQILVLALFLREVLRGKRWRILMWILSGVAIVLTTSKTPIGIYLLFSLMWIFSRGTIRASWRLIPIVAVCVDIFLPFSSLVIKTSWLSVRSRIGIFLAASFADRLQNTWPECIRVVVGRGSVLLGSGLGGIGRALMHFEPAAYVPPDNIAIYLYGTFGVLGLFLLLFYGWKASRMPAESPAAHFLFFCACFVLVYGVTVDTLEGPLTAMVFGISLRYLQELPGKGLRSTLARRGKTARTAGAAGLHPAKA